MRIELAKGAIAIIDALASEGYESFVVGGAVRDSLLGKQVNDFDIATSSPASQTLESLKAAGMKVIPTGIKHGTVTAVLDDGSYEITTYRIDGEYKDSRHPDEVTFTSSIEEDLARRDFTINAMAYSDEAGLVDLHGGMADLESKTIRCVGEPKVRFAEDALRIMRAIRFASQLGFEIDESTASAIHEMRGSLASISHERIRDEFVKLLHGKDATKILSEYEDVIEVFIPAIRPLVGLDLRNPLHVHDAWGHSLATLGFIEPKTTELLLAALLHDIGKGPKAAGDPNAKGRDHAEISAEIVDGILRDLRFPNATIKFVCEIIGGHDEVFLPDPKNIKRFLNEHGEKAFLALLDLKRADICGHGPEAALHAWRIDEIKEMTLGIIERKECYSIAQLAINGDDVKSFGFEGADIKRALETLLLKVIDEECANERQALLDELSVMPLLGGSSVD